MADASKYTILRKVADGGTAEIYLAQRDGPKGFQKAVVLKRIKPALSADPHFRHMLVSEAHVAMGMHHGNIVQVLDLGEAASRYFLVLELVDGWSLDVLLARAAKAGLPLPAELALHVIAQVCRALAYAHGLVRDGKPQAIVHRDISPQNVLVSVQGEVKLTDFGIAKAASQSHVTQRGVIKGKVSYMSPEQASAGELDHRSDLFSLGVVLYQLVTGKLPFHAASPLETLKRIQGCKFAPPDKVRPELSAELVRLILRAMQARPAERFQNAEQMLLEVERVMRAAFPAAGQTELKRWLDELARRDRKLSLLQEWERDCAKKKKESSGEWIMLTSSCAVPLPPPLPLARPKGDRPSLPPVDADDSAEALGPPEEPPNRAIRWVTIGAALVVVAGLAGLGALRHGALERVPRRPEPAQAAGAVAAPDTTPSVKREASAPAAVAQVLVAPTASDLDAGLPAEPVTPPAAVAAEASDPVDAGAPAEPAAVAAAGTDAGAPEAADPEAVSPVPEGEPAPTAAEALAVAEPPVEIPAPSNEQAAAVPAQGMEESPTTRAAKTAVAVPGEQPAEARPVEASARATDPAPAIQAAVQAAAGQGARDERVLLVLSSEPEGALVQVENREFGRTPMTIRFRPGVAYDLTFLKDGYVPTTKRVWVTAGRKEQKVFAFLKRLSK